MFKDLKGKLDNLKKVADVNNSRLESVRDVLAELKGEVTKVSAHVVGLQGAIKKLVTEVEQVKTDNKISMFQRMKLFILSKYLLIGANSEMKRDLLMPYLEEDWAKKRADEAIKIEDSLERKGERIRKYKEELHKEMLEAERKGNETLTASMRAKLELLEEIVE